MRFRLSTWQEKAFCQQIVSPTFSVNNKYLQIQILGAKTRLKWKPWQSEALTSSRVVVDRTSSTYSFYLILVPIKKGFFNFLVKNPLTFFNREVFFLRLYSFQLSIFYLQFIVGYNFIGKRLVWTVQISLIYLYASLRSLNTYWSEYNPIACKLVVIGNIHLIVILIFKLTWRSPSYRESIWYRT